MQTLSIIILMISVAVLLITNRKLIKVNQKAIDLLEHMTETWQPKDIEVFGGENGND